MKIKNSRTGTLAEVGDDSALPAGWEPVKENPAPQGGRKTK